MDRKPYPTDLTDAQWKRITPWIPQDAATGRPPKHAKREILNAILYVTRNGCVWRGLPHDFPPWTAASQQARRWVQAGVFEAITHDLRAIVRFLADREPEPTGVILDGRTLQSTPESGTRVGYDGATRRRGSKVSMAVDTLGHLLAAHVTAASEQDRSQGATLAAKVPEVTGDAVEGAFVDQGYTGEQAAQDAQDQHRRLEVVKLPEAKKGFVLLPRRWVVERTHSWFHRSRRLLVRWEKKEANFLAFIHLACALTTLNAISISG